METISITSGRCYSHCRGGHARMRAENAARLMICFFCARQYWRSSEPTGRFYIFKPAKKKDDLRYFFMFEKVTGLRSISFSSRSRFRVRSISACWRIFFPGLDRYRQGFHGHIRSASVQQRGPVGKIDRSTNRPVESSISIPKKSRLNRD